MSKLDVGLSHDAVLLDGQGAREEGLGNTLEERGKLS